MIQLIESPESIEIAEIQICPEHQSLGLSTRVLSDALENAGRRRKPVSLYLGLENLQAHKLYRRLGFKETGRSDTQIFMECRHS